MKELSIGEMAELNGISRKTLRVYQDAGLVEPIRIDEESGYRYYAPGQAYTIGVIQQFQEMGATLAEIKEALDASSTNAIADLAQRLADELSEKIDHMRLARYNAHQLSRRYRATQVVPLLDRPILRIINRKFALFFDLENTNAIPISGTEGPIVEEWESEICSVKRRITEQGIPSELMQNIGWLMEQSDLESGNFQISKILVYVEAEGLAKRYGAMPIPERTCMTLQQPSFKGKKGNTERDALERLLAAVDEQGLAVAGDCIEEALFTVPAKFGHGRDATYELQVPVVPKS